MNRINEESKGSINKKDMKIDERPLKDFVEDELRKLEKQPWFTPHPDLLTMKKRVLLLALKGMDSIVKFGMYYIRKVGEHFGTFIDYEVGRVLDKDGKPVVYIKLHGIHFLNEFNAELVEEPEFLSEKSEKEQDILYEANRKMITKRDREEQK